MKKKSKGLVNKTLPTITPTTKRNESIKNLSPNIALPNAPINQTPPDFGRRRRLIGRSLQSIALKQLRGKAK